MPGRRPLVQAPPLLVEVAKPMSQEPPSKTRPTWKVATIVEPLEKVSGSTSVWWYVVLEAVQVAAVKGAAMIWGRRTLAKAGGGEEGGKARREEEGAGARGGQRQWG